MKEKKPHWRAWAVVKGHDLLVVRLYHSQAKEFERLPGESIIPVEIFRVRKSSRTVKGYIEIEGEK